MKVFSSLRLQQPKYLLDAEDNNHCRPSISAEKKKDNSSGVNLLLDVFSSLKLKQPTLVTPDSWIAPYQEDSDDSSRDISRESSLDSNSKFLQSLGKSTSTPMSVKRAASKKTKINVSNQAILTIIDCLMSTNEEDELKLKEAGRP